MNLQLEKLDLGGNQIDKINSSAFDGLQNLLVLKLDSNKLTSVPTKALEGLKNLRELNLRGNALKTLNDDSFRDLAMVRKLDLSQAQIANISQHAFRGLHQQLRILNLSANALNALPSIQMSGLNRLKELYFQRNFIGMLNAKCLPELENLEVLDVSNSQSLLVIESFAFELNSRLKRIILNGNAEVQIQSDAFSRKNGAERSLELGMRGLKLQTLHESILADWSTVSQLDMSDNPLLCDCKLLWLHDFLVETRHDSNRTSTAICGVGSGGDLQDKDIADVPRSALQTCSSGLMIARSLNEQIVLISVCVAAALVTAFSIFICVHCRGAARRRSCFSTSASSSDSSTYSTISTGCWYRTKLSTLLCCSSRCCCRRNKQTDEYSSHYNDAYCGGRATSSNSGSSPVCCCLSDALPLANFSQHHHQHVVDTLRFQGRQVGTVRHSQTRSMVLEDDVVSQERKRLSQIPTLYRDFDQFQAQQQQQNITPMSSAATTSSSNSSGRNQSQLFYPYDYGQEHHQQIYHQPHHHQRNNGLWEINDPDNGQFNPLRSSVSSRVTTDFYSNRASSHIEDNDDYFLSVSRDLKTIKPIPVSEL